MNLAPQIIFSKLLPDDSEKLLHDALKTRGVFLCKVQNSEELVHLRIEERQEWVFTTRLEVNSLIPSERRQEVTVSITLSMDRYFMTGHLSKNPNGTYRLEIAPQVFKLQRRQHFRLRIPMSYDAYFALTSLNGESSLLKARIEDLSEGGCRLYLPHGRPELKSDDLIKGHFQMGNRASIPVTGVVRHIKYNSRPTESQLIGVQFQEMTPALENRLFSLVMELHREFFARG